MTVPPLDAGTLDQERLDRGRLDRGRLVRALLVLVPLLLVVGGLIARASGSTEENLWYQSLTLPRLQPPGPVFGIAWSILYTMIAVAAAIVWAKGRGVQRSQALGLFAIGMVVNWSWSPVFFLAHQIEAALAIILVMLGLAIWTTWRFAGVSRVAAGLMLPYIAWLIFAGGLNAAIWQLNPVASAMQMGV
ncbi:TspO/MBR family protein [Polymorphobacter multimanifer]|nr:TspO/MBR family protein [Polymorphobacter multimanifer]